MPESCRACGHRRLGRVAAGKEVGDGLAPETVFDLDGRADLGELERRAGGGDVHERPVDRTEVALGREEQMADDLAADADRDRDRLGITAGLRACPGFHETPPVIATIRRRSGDDPPDVVLDHDPATQVGGKDHGDPRRACVEQHLFSEPLLDDQRAAELRVRVRQLPPELHLVLEPPGMVDGDRRMGGEHRQQVGIVGAEPVPTLGRMEVQGADRLAAEDQRRADDRPEGVAVERARSMLGRGVVVHPDGPLGQDGLCRQPFAEGHLEVEQVRRVPRHRDDPESVALAVPQKDVPAVGAEQTAGVINDRRQDRVEVKGLGDANGRRQEPVDLGAPPSIAGSMAVMAAISSGSAS